MFRFVKIKSENTNGVYHVPENWDNKRVKSELGELFPVDKVTNIPLSKVPEKELRKVYNVEKKSK